MKHLDYPIDENGLLILRFFSPADSHVAATLYSRYGSNSDLVRNILPLTTLGSARAATDSDYHFRIAVSQGGTFDLIINNQFLAHFRLHNAEVIPGKVRRRLSVFETRIIGRAPQHEAPYPVPDNVFDTMLTPITDLHTHLSAQVRAHDLIRMGLDKKHEVYYPVAALLMLGIDHDRDSIIEIPKRLFLPLAHLQSASGGMEPAVALSSLNKAGLETLEQAMSISPEGQCTFEAVEKCYYLREPFTKDIRLLPDILTAVAKNYKKESIAYAELSSNAVLDLAWLKILHETLPRVERETSVHLRFRAGLPRNLDEDALAHRIEQYKRIAASPYIVGPDILGYEINKTSRMQKQLDELAQWMKRHQPDDSLQIHAGENAKNPANVREALEISERHEIRTHIGHSLYGIDSTTFTLAASANDKALLLSQFNVDSNLALNNIDFPSDVPLARFADAGLSIILGSDGSDLYRTTARQTAMAAFFCGVTPKCFRAIRQTEEDYIKRQKLIFDKKSGELPQDFFAAEHAAPSPFKSLKRVIPSVSAETSPALLTLLTSDKKPLFFAGAGGTSMTDVSQPAMAQFIQGLDLLLAGLDPEHFYFIKGRTKKSGVNIELENAVMRYNTNHSIPFDCITMLAETEDAELTHSPHFHTFKLSAPLVNLPTAVISFLKERSGFAFFAGGRNFTRDFILTAASSEYGIDFGIMKDMGGASQEKARIYPEHAFEGASGMRRFAGTKKLITA